MEPEEKQKSDRSALRYLNETAGRARWNILLMVILRAVQSLCSILYAFCLRDIINCAVSGDRQGFIASAAAFALLMLIRLILMAVSRYLRELTSSTLENNMKSRLFSALMSRDYGRVMAVHSGEWMNRLVSDTREAADGMSEIFPDAAGMIIRLAGAAVSVAFLVPGLMVIIIPVTILAVLASVAVRRTLKRLHKNIREQDGKLRAFLQDSLGSVRVRLN